MFMSAVHFAPSYILLPTLKECCWVAGGDTIVHINGVLCMCCVCVCAVCYNMLCVPCMFAWQSVLCDQEHTFHP